MRYVPREAFHPILGPNTEVVDLKTKRVVTLFTGYLSTQRAESRCRQLEVQDQNAAHTTGS